MEKEKKAGFNVLQLTNEQRNAIEQRLQSKKAYTARLAPIKRQANGHESILSFAQQRLWFLDQLQPGSSYYNVPVAVEIGGELSHTTLKQAFTLLMQRHEALRTFFVQREGEPRQIVVPQLPLPLTLCDLGELPPAQQQERVEQLARQEAIQPFALDRAPLLRLTLLRLGARHHVLLLTIHHIIWDGWSTAICLQEIAHIYQTLEEGKTPEVPALSIQYADYAHWQREQVQGEFLNRQLDYWREKLAGLAPLELPLDRPRPELPSYQGELIAINFPADLTRALKALCKQEGVTLFMLLLAAFQTLLYRYSGQHDIAIGSPIANRNRSEIEHVIGFFVNTLVVRTHFQGNPSFGELLQQVRESALQAYAHQDVPFEKLVEALHPERTLNVTPLFQIMFILQSNRLENLKIPGLSIKGQATHSHTSKFDITVDAVETDEGDLATSIEFSTDIFDKATIVRMMCHFQYLLSQITKNPDVRVDEIQCIPPEEQKELLARGNGARQSRHYRHSVDNFIALQAQKTPDAIAVIYGTEQITYRRLEEEIERLASYLQHLGVESETVVGVCLESSLEMIIAILGILKAGGAYLPIDYTFPSERITLMLNDAEPFLIIAQMHLTKCLSAYQRQILCIDSDLTWKTAVEPRQSYTQMNRLAYIIYTSGSTGIPKGVAVEHQSLASYVTAAKKLYNLREGDRVLQFSSINWDTSSEEIYPCLVSGATLVLLTKATSLAFSNLKQLCREAAITVINVPTACWHDMADEVADSDLDSYSTLRLVIFGGEQAKARALKQWTKHHMQHIQLLNEFGMTEATAVTTTYMPESLDAHRRYLPIGHPIEANQVYVLNSALLPVPIGVTGQLYIGGRGLSRGYFKRPDATAERFIPDPFSMQPGARLFATGDYARYRVNGDLEHLGRMDKRVKIRGIRIEINEVEAALLEHPSIERAAVKAREEATGNNELVAYIVCKGQRRTPPEIKLFLQKKLPNYMLPARYIFLDMLPLSLAGKIDYLQLPQPDSLRPELDIAYVPPDNDIEQRISMLWRQVLNLDKVGVHDNFFDIGGHSLALIKVHKLLEQNFAREIPLVELYRYSTIRLQKQYLVGEYEEKSRTRIDQERMKKQRQAISRQHLLSKKRREE